ncbi:uncharacterized protein GGS22DRAFT_149808 [Annulohypoxylon maeteangense]|uniref:uncharacterized protein n=1 Tax=Annulohypoxylon maeteangense TaxID=1927788 RepID=UPI00200774AA|nr:uncharacterized protein GGS22DRAFT_149808 [Annulohypoxylon maeteangense]KAI0890024.1 hypothetical protein GGS22DRAFT_149808 [Annulohypoxylon maeteangense]
MRALNTLLTIPLTGATALTLPNHHPRQTDCTDLSTSTPNWQINNAASSDWPGGASGRVELFARHLPTQILTDCDVEYRLDADGKLVDYDPTAVVTCTNFGGSTLSTNVTLDMDMLLLKLTSSWTCEGSEERYTATGETTLDRDTSPGACRVEPSQVGDATTCPIADVVVEGKLAEA